MNEEVKAVEAAKAEARPQQEKGEVGRRKTYHRPELKRQGGMAQVTGFTF